MHKRRIPPLNRTQKLGLTLFAFVALMPLVVAVSLLVDVP